MKKATKEKNMEYNGFLGGRLAWVVQYTTTHSTSPVPAATVQMKGVLYPDRNRMNCRKVM
jgi:hypothetical protein